MIYYGVTSLIDICTLGEEYTHIQQYNSTNFEENGILTSRNKKILNFLLKVFAGYFLKKLFKNKFDNLRNSYNQTFDLQKNENIWAKAFFANSEDYEGIETRFFKFHLALFLLKGNFFEVSKRILNIKYIFQRSPQEHNIQYGRIGLLLLF